MCRLCPDPPHSLAVSSFVDQPSFVVKYAMASCSLMSPSPTSIHLQYNMDVHVCMRASTPESELLVTNTTRR